jgi:hypothetical protein
VRIAPAGSFALSALLPAEVRRPCREDGSQDVSHEGEGLLGWERLRGWGSALRALGDGRLNSLLLIGCVCWAPSPVSLVTGDVHGQLDSLFAKVSKVHASKAGPFHALFCVGANFFGRPHQQAGHPMQEYVEGKKQGQRRDNSGRGQMHLEDARSGEQRRAGSGTLP